jgi:hypothetical protein
MEPMALAGMLSTLILALMVGGFILLFPLSRRLGSLLDARLESRKAQPRVGDEEIAALRDNIENLANELRRVNDRQDFIEKLLAPRVEARLTSTTARDNERP